MRKNIRAIFVISALVALVLCSACVFPSLESEKPQEEWPFPGYSARNIHIISVLKKQNRNSKIIQLINGSAERLPIYYIFSQDVDNSGNAETWLFGVRHSTGTELLMYDRTGWKIIPWNATLPSEEIILNQVVSPNTLFIQNKDVIFSASSPSIPERRDLELKQGVYTLTITFWQYKQNTYI